MATLWKYGVLQGEFENESFKLYCEENGIDHSFSCARNPQKNEIVERKNISLQEMARSMLCDKNLPKYFWAETINTACHILNSLHKTHLKKTPYELYKGRKPNIGNFHVFSSTCYIFNNGKEALGKFDAKSDEGIFLGYSSQSKGYRVFNKRTLVVEETIQVIIDDINVEIPKLKEDCENEVTQNLKRLSLEQNESNTR